MTTTPSACAGATVAFCRSEARVVTTRARRCEDCGRVEHVRADNPAVRCRPCASRPALEKGRDTRSAARNWEVCRHCRRRFAAPPSSKQKYCSRSCLLSAKSIERRCTTCGGTFRVARSVLSGRTNSSARFCSRPCYEHHLCRTGRVNGRGSRWRTIRRKALRRTPFCAYCGRLKTLQVHHIIPFRLTRDNAQTNLIPLCRACHKGVETVFHDLEAADLPIPLTKLVLFCCIHARRSETVHKLRKLLSHVRQQAAA